MRIAVVGIGGVGGYIGAKLSQLKDEHEIIFVARGEHLQSIQDNGLCLDEPESSDVYFPTHAVDTIESPVDVIFLCTKTYHTKEAIATLQNAITDKTLIIAIANGVNSKEMISPLTDARVSQACVYVVSHKVAPGHIKKATKPFLLVIDAEYQARLEDLFTATNIKVKFTDDISKELWKKYLFIAAQASLTSFYQQGMGTIYQEHQNELTQVLEEIFSVAKAMGVNIEEKEITKALETSSKIPLDAPTSLWLDIQRGGHNELESLIHYVILEAKKHEVPVPLMERMYETLSQR